MPSYLDSIRLDNTKESAISASSSKSIKTQITKDATLNDILADTAATTLREQLSAESRKGNLISSAGDKAARIVSKADPSELFGDASQKWAQLAFADPIAKR